MAVGVSWVNTWYRNATGRTAQNSPSSLARVLAAHPLAQPR